MGERVKSAGHHLEARHAEGVRRIEKREAGVAFGVIAAGLHMKILIGDDGAAVALAARSRDGDHNAERQGVKPPEGALLRPEIVPDIAVVSRGYGNGLAAVHDRPAAHSDNEPHIFFSGQSRAFEHLLIGGVGHDAGEFNDFPACRAERGADFIVDAVAPDGSAAPGEHDAALVRGGQSGEIFPDASVAEKHFCRIFKDEIFHDVPSSDALTASPPREPFPGLPFVAEFFFSSSSFYPAPGCFRYAQRASLFA